MRVMLSIPNGEGTEWSCFLLKVMSDRHRFIALSLCIPSENFLTAYGKKLRINRLYQMHCLLFAILQYHRSTPTVTNMLYIYA